jgi:catechol-2,3-dioxygenase
MDAPNPSAIPTAASRAPIHIGAVGMIVRDLDRVTAYYRDMLGLTVQEHTRQVAKLGVGGVALLELIHRPDALPDDPREAGLYHTAFLMPTRADLARWILHRRRVVCPLLVPLIMNGAGVRNGKRAGLDWVAMEINDQPTTVSVKKRLDAAGIKIDAIPGGFAATDPWGTSIRFTIAP